MQNPFFDYENLEPLVKPIEPGFPYFRPFILHGDPKQVDVFLVGINPATPIFPEDGVTMDNWIESITDHKVYNQRYSSNGRTRTGINGLLSYIKSHYPFSIIETNINAFPTRKAIELTKRENLLAAQEGKKYFHKVLLAHEPSIIILFGKGALNDFIDFLILSKYMTYHLFLEDTPIEECENTCPFISFFYPSGKEAKVFACRHLKLFGHKGESYKKFLEGITPFLTRQKETRTEK